jgi:hypothetical protein
MFEHQPRPLQRVTPDKATGRRHSRAVTRWGGAFVVVAGLVGCSLTPGAAPAPTAESSATPTTNPLLAPAATTTGDASRQPPPATGAAVCGPEAAVGGTPVAALAAANADPAGLGDWAIAGGWFYTQGAGSTGGYSVVDDAQARFWSQFLDLGGWRTLGFPVSRRFVLDGKLSQLTQRALLQWSPATGRVELTDVLDLLHERERDGALRQQHQVPPPTAVDQVNRDYATVVARRLAWLERRPAIKRQYCRAPGGSDPIALWGLPTSDAVDVSGNGSVYVLRTQRAAFQEWVGGLTVDGVQIAAPGQVTVVLAGDLAKDYGLIPCTALSPEPSPRAPATPPDDHAACGATPAPSR